MASREEMIRDIRRQKMIDEIRANRTQEAPEKSGVEEFADLARSTQANFESLAPLQGVRDRLGAGADALIGQTKDTFGEDSGKSLTDHYEQSLAETSARRAVDKDRSNTGKILGSGMGLASNFLLPTPSSAAGVVTNATIAGVDAATQGPNDISAKEGAKGAATSFGIDMLLKGAGKAISKLPAAITGVTDDMADYYKANHQAVDAARPLSNVTDDLIDSTKSFRREMSNQSTEGFNALKNSGMSATASQLDEPIAAQISRLGDSAVTAPAKANVAELSSLRESIAGEMASNNNVLGAAGLDKVKTFVRQIDDLIDYEAVKMGRATSRDKALMTIRQKYDDLLKNSPEYSDVMSGLSSKASALDDVASQLKSHKSADNFLGRLSKNKDPRGADALANLDENMGTAYSKEVKDAGVKDFFTRENSRGTRNTIVAGSVGALAGSVLGVPPWIAGPAAATAGPVVDKFGRQIYQNLLRAQAQHPEIMAQYVKVLNTAAQSGPASLIATHQLLKKDPTYSKITGE